jgi:hypothetical protein
MIHLPLRTRPRPSKGDVVLSSASKDRRRDICRHLSIQNFLNGHRPSPPWSRLERRWRSRRAQTGVVATRGSRAGIPEPRAGIHVRGPAIPRPGIPIRGPWIAAHSRWIARTHSWNPRRAPRVPSRGPGIASPGPWLPSHGTWPASLRPHLESPRASPPLIAPLPRSLSRHLPTRRTLAVTNKEGG